MKNSIIECTDKFILKKETLKTYLRLKTNYSSDEFLLFILQRSDRNFWRKKLKDNFSNNVISYFSFVQREIKNNWFLLSENFEGIETPTFLTFESSQTLMVKLIDFFKDRGNFKEINFSNEELAQKMLSNLYSLSAGNNSYGNFSKLIKKQNLFSKLKDESYDELNKLLEIYLSRTLKLGVFDYPATLYIYNNYLLENDIYVENIKKYKAILIDDFQSQIPCITNFLKHIESFTGYHSSFGAYGIYYPNSQKDLTSLGDIQKKVIETSDIFLEKLYENFFYEKKNSLITDKVKIKTDFEEKSDLHEYLLSVLKKVHEKTYKNILILSPSRNITLIDSLERLSYKENIPFLNLDKNEKFLDNPYIYALSSLGIIYFNYGKLYLNEDEIRQILVLLFGINIFRASDIAKKNPANSEFLKKIEKASVVDLTIFLEHFDKNHTSVVDFYRELLTQKNRFDKKIVDALEKIYDFSKLFLDNISSFDNIRDKNLEFFTTLRKGIKESESLDEISKKMEFNGVMLGTPASFLKLSKKVEISIFIDIESNLWNLNFINFLQNPFLLNGTFKEKEYDFESDSYLKREELYNLISSVYIATEKKMMVLGTKYKKTSLMCKVFNG